jgi:hypothetical protein
MLRSRQRSTRLLFFTGGKKEECRLVKGDFVMAVPASGASRVAGDQVSGVTVKGARASKSAAPSDARAFLATYIDQSHAVFVADATEQVQPATSMTAATDANKAAFIQQFEASLANCKALAKRDSEEVVKAAFDTVTRTIDSKGIGEGDQLPYAVSAGGGSPSADQLLCQTLMEKCGEPQGPALLWMSGHWEEVSKPTRSMYVAASSRVVQSRPVPPRVIYPGPPHPIHVLLHLIPSTSSSTASRLHCRLASGVQASRCRWIRNGLPG